MIFSTVEEPTKAGAMAAQTLHGALATLGFELGIATKELSFQAGTFTVVKLARVHMGRLGTIRPVGQPMEEMTFAFDEAGNVWVSPGDRRAVLLNFPFTESLPSDFFHSYSLIRGISNQLLDNEEKWNSGANANDNWSR